MANEFKIKKGLIVTGASGGTVVDIQGSQGQLFSVTDNLSGSIFAVSDISGVPIFDVNSSGLSTFDGALAGTSATFSGSVTAASGTFSNLTSTKFPVAGTGGLLENSILYKLNYNAIGLDTTGRQFFGNNFHTISNAVALNLHAGLTSSVNLKGDGADILVASTGGNVNIPNGKLGIGMTTAPSALLYIKGTGDAIRVESTNTGAGGAQLDLLQYSTSPADGDTMAYVNMGGYYDTVPNQAYFASIKTIATDVSARQGALTFTTRNGSDFTEKMRIDSAGAIKFNAYDSTNNTGTPTYLLGTDASGNVVKTNTVPGSGAGPYLPLSAGPSYPLTGDLYQTMGAIGVAQTDQDYLAKIYESNADGFMSLYTGQPTPLERIRISSYGDSFFVPANNGNVGIGVTGPDSRLTVSSGTTNAVANFKSTDAAAYIAIADNSSTNALVNQIGVTGNDMWFATDDVERMRIDSAGAIKFNAYGAGTLVTDASGNITASSGGGAGGPYLPLSAGTGFPLTGGLSFSITTDTVSPVASIKHNSNNYVYFTGGTNGGLFGNSNQSVRLQANATSLELLTDGSSRMFIDTAGNVGIGTTNPAQDFVVADATNGNGIELVPGATATIQTYNRGTSSYNNLNIDTARTQIRSIDYTSFHNGSSYGEKMRITTAGNVGIGTTAPSATEPIGGNLPTGWTRTGSRALEIAAPDFANSGLFLRNSGTTATGTDITGDQYFGDTYIDNRYDSDNGSIYFRTKTAVTPQIRMAIKGSGKVGIGTTSPDTLLNIEGSSPILTIEDSRISIGDGTIMGRIDFKQNDNSGSGTGVSGSIYSISSSATGQGSDLAFTTGVPGSTTEKMRIQSTTGNVGIGTTTPLAKLDIQGTQGQLFSVTDDLSGSIFAVADISGVPIFDVNSSGVSYFDGKVGIGTNSPNRQLSIYGTNDGYMSFDGGRTGNHEFVVGSEASGFIIYDDTLDTYRFVIDQDSGNVGIGTTSPTQKLNVVNDNTGTWTAKFTNNTNNVYLSVNDANNYGIYVSGETKNYFSGNIGIGTTGPDEKLTVNGITRAVDPIYFGAINTDNGTYGPYIESSDNKGLKFDYNGNTGGEFQVWNHDQNGGGAFQVFNIDQDGNVGINITSGSDKLTLKGAFSLYDTNAISAVIRLNPNGDSYINGGDLGVGITLPQHKLDVGGTIRSYNYRLAGNTTNPTTTAATIYDQSGVGLTLSAHNVELRNYNGSSMVRSVFFTHNTATFTGTCTATNFILSSDESIKR